MLEVTKCSKCGKRMMAGQVPKPYEKGKTTEYFNSIRNDVVCSRKGCKDGR